MKLIYLCAINNVQSGICNEDCKFCTQSIHNKIDIKRYKQKDINQIIQEAKIAYKNNAVGYCLVTSGARLDDKKVDYISKIASAIKKELPYINLIACNGLATKEQLIQLKQSGINSYNHNLETSKNYYKNICSTHSWEQRYITCENINSTGLILVSGGIFGMGETIKDRDDFLYSLKSLNPTTVPINFYHPHPSLSLTNNVIDIHTAFSLIKKTKEIVNPRVLMIAGGREITFQDKQYEIFNFGANAIVIGDYLTTSGYEVSKDILNLQKLGYTIAKNCD
jgi:biotin synthase